MLRYENIIEKYGEYTTQAILENWEHYECVHYNEPLTLKERWELFLFNTDEEPLRWVA